jgi:hypothetical protein
LPSFEFFFSSTRSGGLPLESGSFCSLPPYQIVGFIAPEIFGTPLDQSYWGGRNFFELTAYVGIISTLLALMTLIFQRNEYITAFSIVIIFSLFYAFGRFTPFYRFLYNYIPGFNLFRVPSTTLFIYVFSISVLSGFGFSFLFSKMSREKKQKLIKFNKFLILVLLILIIVTSILYFQKERILKIGEIFVRKKYETYSDNAELKSIDRYLEKVNLAYSHIIQSVVTLILLLFLSILLINWRTKKKFPKKILEILIVLLLLINLWVFWQKYLLIVKPEELYENPKIEEVNVSDLISVIEKDNERFRVYDSSDWILPQHITIRQGIELVNGYDLSIMGRYEKFTSELLGYRGDLKEDSLSRGMEILNSRYFITTEELANNDFSLVYYTNRTIKMMPRAFIAASKYETNQTYIYRNQNVLPRAYTVPNAEVTGNETQILDELKSKEFNPKETVIFEENPDKPLTNKGEFQEADIVFYSPNEIKLEVNMSEPGYLVLSEIWYPGWKAYDNGEELDIFRANYILRSVYLDKGNHKIKFIYKPNSLKIGFLIASGTILFLVLVTIFIIISGKNKRSPEKIVKD